MSAPTQGSFERRAGFTLLELMVTATILSVVIYMTLDSLTRQQKTSIVTEKVVEAQQNLRAIGSLLERELRMAGFMVPDGAGVCGLDRTTGPDEIFVSDSSPIVPDDARAGTLGARLSVALSTPLSGTAISLTLDSTTSDLDGDGSYFYDNDNDGTPEADFRVGGGFILADANNPERGAVCGTVSGATPTSLTGTRVAGNLDGYNAAVHAAEDLVVVPAVYYRVDTASAAGRLERNGDLLTNGVDDFQVSYFYDVDDDGEIDSSAAEEPGTSGGSVFNPQDWDNSTLKEVRFSIVLRTRDDDPEYSEGNFLSFENRTPPGGGNDGFRRRVIQSSVRPRNVAAPGAI